MALFRCMVKSGGGGSGLTETQLWENSSPGATAGFTAKKVTLSGNIENYDYICVEYAKAYNALTTKAKVYWKVSDFQNFALSAGSLVGSISSMSNGPTLNSRGVRYESATEVYFGASYAGGSTTNTWNIPLYIYGCK